MPFKQTFHQNDPLDAPEDLIPVKQAYHYFLLCIQGKQAN